VNRARRAAARLGRLAVLIALGACATACTTISMATLPPAVPGQKPVLVTTGDAGRPYQSLGLVQVYRAGYTFGWFAVPGDVNLNDVMRDYFIAEAARRGADAVIHVRFHEDQYTPGLRTIMTIPPLIFVPLPTSVTISGELVRFAAQ